MDLWIILIPLFVGIAIGYVDLWPDFLEKTEGPLSHFALLLLLTLMGTKIGSDGEILSSIGNIGLISLAIAAGSIVGSVILLGLVAPALKCISNESGEVTQSSGNIHLKLTVSILVSITIGVSSVIPSWDRALRQQSIRPLTTPWGCFYLPSVSLLV